MGNLSLTPYGHTFRADSDSLRAALDATVLSPTGQAVGVDEDGKVVGVTSYERLRAAIQRGADEAQRVTAGPAAGHQSGQAGTAVGHQSGQASTEVPAS